MLYTNLVMKKKYLLIIFYSIIFFPSVGRSSHFLAPHSNMDRPTKLLMLTGPVYENFIPRTTHSLEETQKRINQVINLPIKNTHLLILRILVDSGILSKEVQEFFSDHSSAEVKFGILYLSRHLQEIQSWDQLQGTQLSPELSVILQRRAIQIEWVEGFPLLTSWKESTQYWSRKLPIDQLLPPSTSETRLRLMNRQSSKPTHNIPANLASTPPPMTSSNQPGSSRDFELMRPNQMPIQVLDPTGGLWAKTQRVLNMEDSILRIIQLSLLNDPENLQLATHLLFKLELQQNLFSIMNQLDLLDYTFTLVPLFESLSAKDLRQVLFHILQNEKNGPHYELALEFVSTIIDEMRPSLSLEMFEELLLNTQNTSTHYEQLVTDILDHLFFYKHNIYIWTQLATQYPEQLWHWEDFYLEPKKNSIKKNTSLMATIRGFRHRVLGLSSQRKFNFQSVISMIESMDQEIKNTPKEINFSSAAQKKLKEISDLIFLGQNGYSTFMFFQSNQYRYASIIPQLIKQQPPKIIATFIIETMQDGPANPEMIEQRSVELLKYLSHMDLDQYAWIGILDLLFENTEFLANQSVQTFEQLIRLGSNDSENFEFLIRLYTYLEEDSTYKGRITPLSYFVSSGILLNRQLKDQDRWNLILNTNQQLSSLLSTPFLQSEFSLPEIDSDILDDLPESVQRYDIDYQRKQQELIIEATASMLQLFADLNIGASLKDFQEFKGKQKIQKSIDTYLGPIERTQIDSSDNLYQTIQVDQLKPPIIQSIELLFQFSLDLYHPTIRHMAINSLKSLDPTIVEFIFFQFYQAHPELQPMLLNTYDQLSTFLASSSLDKHTFYRRQVHQIMRDFFDKHSSEKNRNYIINLTEYRISFSEAHVPDEGIYKEILKFIFRTKYRNTLAPPSLETPSQVKPSVIYAHKALRRLVNLPWYLIDNPKYFVSDLLDRIIQLYELNQYFGIHAIYFLIDQIKTLMKNEILTKFPMEPVFRVFMFAIDEFISNHPQLKTSNDSKDWLFFTQYFELYIKYFLKLHETLNAETEHLFRQNIILSHQIFSKLTSPQRSLWIHLHHQWIHDTELNTSLNTHMERLNQLYETIIRNDYAFDDIEQILTFFPILNKDFPSICLKNTDLLLTMRTKPDLESDKIIDAMQTINILIQTKINQIDWTLKINKLFKNSPILITPNHVLSDLWLYINTPEEFDQYYQTYQNIIQNLSQTIHFVTELQVYKELSDLLISQKRHREFFDLLVIYQKAQNYNNPTLILHIFYRNILEHPDEKLIDIFTAVEYQYDVDKDIYILSIQSAA